MKTHQPIFMYMLVTLFIGLKLAGQIEWHWAWVLSPLWISFAASFLIAFVTAFRQGWNESKRENTQTGKGG